jgi:cephalosporin-C deacetylase
VSRYLAIHRDKVESVFRTLNYFDVVNHVPQARAKALLSVGLMDVTCPPSTVYAAFNAYGGADKQIVSYSFNDHEGGGAFQEREQLSWMKTAL